MKKVSEDWFDVLMDDLESERITIKEAWERFEKLEDIQALQEKEQEDECT